jgi:tetratricopeptide (TPR) repeat protein
MERLGVEAERYLRAAVEGQPLWVRGELQEELRGHVMDAIARRVGQGMLPAAAEREALEALGPVDGLRRDLAQARRAGRRLGDPFMAGLLDWSLRLPLDWLAAPLQRWQGRPVASFRRDYQLGRYDAIIARGEVELAHRGPRFDLHHELGLAYSAIGQLERALDHLEAEVTWLKSHPLPRLFGGHLALATAYSNVAGVLERMGKLDDADLVLAEGLQVDPRHGMLHLQRARRHATRQKDQDVLRDLEALLEDHRLRPRGQLLLFVAQDPAFSDMRDDAQFQRLLLRAAAA